MRCARSALALTALAGVALALNGCWIVVAGAAGAGAGYVAGSEGAKDRNAAEKEAVSRNEDDGADTR